MFGSPTEPGSSDAEGLDGVLVGGYPSTLLADGSLSTFALRRSLPVWSPTVHRRSSRTTSDTASRPSSRSAQATFSASVTCSDTVTPPPPTSTFTRVEVRPSRFFWDRLKVVSR